MKLYDFLFEKGALRKFKRNWLRYRYYHRADKPTQDKEFNAWLERWGESSGAIVIAFRWSIAKYGKDKYWSRIDNEWRDFIKSKQEHQ